MLTVLQSLLWRPLNLKLDSIQVDSSETSTQKRKLEIIFRGKLKTADITVEQSRYSTYTDVEDDLEIFGIGLVSQYLINVYFWKLLCVYK